MKFYTRARDMTFDPFTATLICSLTLTAIFSTRIITTKVIKNNNNYYHYHPYKIYLVVLLK